MDTGDTLVCPLETLRQAVTPPPPAAQRQCYCSEEICQQPPALGSLGHAWATPDSFCWSCLYVATGLGSLGTAAVCVTWISGHLACASSATKHCIITLQIFTSPSLTLTLTLNTPQRRVNTWFYK